MLLFNHIIMFFKMQLEKKELGNLDISMYSLWINQELSCEGQKLKLLNCLYGQCYRKHYKHEVIFRYLFKKQREYFC